MTVHSVYEQAAVLTLKYQTRQDKKFAKDTNTLAYIVNKEEVLTFYNFETR
jgi:hypothetical protein